MPRLPTAFRTTPKPTERQWASRQGEERGWYGLAVWIRLRKVIIERDCYLCQACGCVVHVDGPKDERTANVDHIKRHNRNWDLFIDPSNLQTLCAACHSAKTAREDGGFWNG